MNQLSRLIRHLFATLFKSRHHFSAKTLKDIEIAIATGEIRHSAEIRVIIETTLSFSDIWQKKSSRDRALELFGRYRIWDTTENIGILVYLNIADRKVEIITDHGVDQKIPSKEWENICITMTQRFKEKHFHDGILEALTNMNILLQKHFPSTEERKNDLSDTPLIL